VKGQTEAVFKRAMQDRLLNLRVKRMFVKSCAVDSRVQCHAVSRPRLQGLLFTVSLKLTLLAQTGVADSAL
jgi:hypothetical protein